MRKTITPSVLVVLLGLFAIAHAGTITPEEAGKHTGNNETVCGDVVRAFYATSSKGQPTLIDLGGFFLSRVFTVVIWGEDRNKFEKPPETLYGGKKICVTGTIKSYRGRPEIIVRDPSQIEVEGESEAHPPK